MLWTRQLRPREALRAWQCGLCHRLIFPSLGRLDVCLGRFSVYPSLSISSLVFLFLCLLSPSPPPSTFLLPPLTWQKLLGFSFLRQDPAEATERR